MSENKFIKHLRGEQTAKSVLELKNQRAKTSFANMPHGTSNGDVVYSDHRGNATAVLKGTDNWKLNGSSLIVPTEVYGDGRDVTGTYDVAGQTLWVDASYTFTDPKLFTPNTKWVLKLCGNRLMSMVEGTIPLTMLIKFGATTVVTKAFAIKEHAFNFSEELVIDFAESNANNIKVAANNTMTVQVLCGDATATAQIYNGMTVFTALQRRVDGGSIASDKKTFDELVEDVEDLEEYVDATFVKKAGDTMSGALNIANIAPSNTPLLTLTHSSTATYKWNIAPRYNSTTLSIYPGSTETNGFRFATTGFVPASNNARYLGSASLKWKGVYTAMINNGGDLAVPANTTGTLATKADVDLAANSGRMITAQGVWYAKMYAATVPPAAEDGTNYADFSQVDGQGNPIIVTYNRVSGAWVQDQTITPPAEYDGYVPITSKIWDIAEQENQQGGRVMWNHQSKEFTPYPLIVDVSYLIDEIDTKQDKLTAGNNITITRLVPDGYDVLEYIESDGTQYIDTQVPVNIQNSFDIDCVLLSGNSDAHLISEGNVSIRVGANAFTWYTQAAHYLSTFTPGDNYNIQCGLNYLTVNGNTISGTTDSDNVSGTSVYLLARNTAVSQCKARIKHVKIYDANSDLAFDGTPAIRNADGVVGLYDSVSETFFANSDAGASNFIAGGKIASTVISSTADPLPSQAGNSGKFLTTDGTDASWSDKPLVNTATATNSLTILGTANTTRQRSTNIGVGSVCSQNYTVAVGYGAQAGGNSSIYIGTSGIASAIGSIVIGASAGTPITGSYSIAIGYQAKTGAANAIQINASSSQKTNSDSNTVKIGNANGNFEIMSADGTIPTDRFTTTPSTDGTYVPTLTISSGVATRSWGSSGGGHEVIAFQAPNAGNNYTWYRKYADGWVEQGGYVSTAFQDNTTVSLAVTMADTHYHVSAIAYYGTASQDGANVYIYDVTTSSVSISNKMYGGNVSINCYWEVKGMMA